MSDAEEETNVIGTCSVYDRKEISFKGFSAHWNWKMIYRTIEPFSGKPTYNTSEA